MNFYGTKEAGDNRWLNSSIFYNPTILKKKGPSKKDLSEMEMLKPNHIGLKEDMSWKVDVNHFSMTTSSFQLMTSMLNLMPRLTHSVTGL